MFTGLVECMGTVRRTRREGDGTLLEIATPFARETSIGESIALNGACLTVIANGAEGCTFQAGPETLKRTNLGELKVGDAINLERSLIASARLGGHLMQGHIDGLGTIKLREQQGDWVTMWFTCPADLGLQMVRKGSIAVDGVSLTLVDVEKECFSVALIPHTLVHTTLGHKPEGAGVNIETDILGKYVHRMLAAVMKEKNGL